MPKTRKAKSVIRWQTKKEFVVASDKIFGIVEQCNDKGSQTYGKWSAKLGVQYLAGASSIYCYDTCEDAQKAVEANWLKGY